MEDTLRDLEDIKLRKVAEVLILILMENTLRGRRTSSRKRKWARCLNPYSNGI